MGIIVSEQFARETSTEKTGRLIGLPFELEIVSDFVREKYIYIEICNLKAV